MRKEGKTIYLTPDYWGKLDSIVSQMFGLDKKDVSQHFKREFITSMIDLAETMLIANSNKYELIIEINNLMQSYLKTNGKCNETRTTTINPGRDNHKVSSFRGSSTTPETPEKYLQEEGRQGRDGENCIESQGGTAGDYRDKEGNTDSSKLQNVIDDHHHFGTDHLYRTEAPSGSRGLCKSKAWSGSQSTAKPECESKREKKRINELNNESKVTE
ncbi:hypothetical protein [Flammeovirga aprica]|uniref:Uncharacterized protein n=1 Tax=Flammeovirga aprica JL-4 TaxID=694437 RepID=A0A7X9RTG9_9BACT|nr:hypothetical protein [Flammeovirga aprica]NME67217.1 hypothetical protein [Flammeovirga aprica JL-4]